MQTLSLLKKIHKNIDFYHHPYRWIKDKYKTVHSQPKIYILAAIPSIFVLIGVCADFITIFDNVGKEVFSILLLCFLFVFGLINLYLITYTQRLGVRLLKQKTTAVLLHTELIEVIKEYHSLKNYKIVHHKPLKEKQIKDYIMLIIKSFHTQYLTQYYGKDITVTIKYLVRDMIIPLRYGGNSEKGIQILNQ